uniref:Uncharacterized protein n=1 Tax=Solanum tuberosum TaxID=4113 RepID=M1B3N5_SOLTU
MYIPETTVAKLFASVKRNGMQLNQYEIVAQCLQQLPSGQMRVILVQLSVLSCYFDCLLDQPTILVTCSRLRLLSFKVF